MKLGSHLAPESKKVIPGNDIMTEIASEKYISFEACVTGVDPCKERDQMKEIDILQLDFVKYGKACDCLGHIVITIPEEKEFIFRELVYYKYICSDKEAYGIDIVGVNRFSKRAQGVGN